MDLGLVNFLKDFIAKNPIESSTKSTEKFK